MVADRIRQVTNASGVAIAVIHNDQLEFCTATGVLSSLAGSSAPVGSNLPELLRANSWSAVERAIHYDARCPIVFPVFHEGRTTGLVHLSFSESDKLEEHQIRACQVMAGLMGEAISRVSEMEWKQTLAAERTSMLEILEKLRPQLERLAAESNGQAPSDAVTDGDIAALLRTREPEAERGSQSSAKPARTPGTNYCCQQCGTPMNEEEVFCEKCGAPQLTDLASLMSNPKQSASEPLPWPNSGAPQSSMAESQPDDASLEKPLTRFPVRDVVARFKPRPRIAPKPAPESEVVEPPAIEPDSADTPTGQPAPADFLSAAALRDGSFTLGIPGDDPVQEERPHDGSPEAPAVLARSAQLYADESMPPITSLTPAAPSLPKPSPWASAAKAQEWLESLQNANSPGRVWLSRHRADLWVGLSLILLLLALSGWGSRSVIYGAAQSKVVQPSLTLFERVLIGLDLAQPPPAPVYMGNPNVQVWIDLHTALYYCPGAELYGKTPEGKYTTQRDAQLDQFEPAARAYCQ